MRLAGSTAQLSPGRVVLTGRTALDDVESVPAQPVTPKQEFRNQFLVPVRGYDTGCSLQKVESDGVAA
jgi:hypothetical protein